MRIQHNIAALNSHRQLGNNNNAVAKNLEKLSSGYKINRAGDDAAGLAISEKMRAQITGLKTAQKNANDGISLVQTAEGALTEVHSMLNRMVELTDQSANGTYDDSVDRVNLQKEITSLKSEIDRISEGTNFNGINLLDGSMGGYSGNAAATTPDLKMSVVGGSLAAADTVAVTSTATSGQASAAGSQMTVAITIGGTSYGSATSAADLKTAGLTLNVSNDDKGNYTFNLTAGKDASDALKKAIGSGITVNGSLGSAAATSTLTVDAAGAKSGSLKLQIGDTADEFNQLAVSVGSMDSKSLGIGAISIATQKDAKAAVDLIKHAINRVSSTRGDLGAAQNRLDHTINNLSVTTENMTAAESRIRDVDMAEEMMTFTKNNILTQASQSMLAQANQLPQGVLQLLQ
ncbi:MAG: flagellin [Lachnospiraceae bacterium]